MNTDKACVSSVAILPQAVGYDFVESFDYQILRCSSGRQKCAASVELNYLCESVFICGKSFFESRGE